MKKLFFITLMLLTTLIMITACNDKELLSEGQEQTSPVENENEGAGENVNGSNRRYLILYCSRTGNTEQMARTIQSILNCDMIVVEPETAYEEDYNAMLDRAQAELDDIAQGNYPKITTSVESFNDYDIVFIGYPIWFGHMATPMQTFLHNHADSLSGKHIALFATSGSSGISTSERDAASLVPDVIFEKSLLLTSNSLASMNTWILAWIEELGIRQTDTDSVSRLQRINNNIRYEKQ